MATKVSAKFKVPRNRLIEETSPHETLANCKCVLEFLSGVAASGDPAIIDQNGLCYVIDMVVDAVGFEAERVEASRRAAVSHG